MAPAAGGITPPNPSPQPTAAAMLVRRSCLSLSAAAAAGLGCSASVGGAMPVQNTCVPMETAKPGDTITIGTSILAGDLVILVEVSPNQFVQKAISEEEAALYSGPKYRVYGTESRMTESEWLGSVRLDEMLGFLHS